MDIKKCKRYETLISMMVGTVIVLVLIWTNTFIHQNSYSAVCGNFSYLGTCIIPIVGTVFYYWLIFSDPILGMLKDSTKLCAAGTAIAGIIFLGALLLELGADGFSLFGEKNIVIFGEYIPKKYVYDVWTVIWFPLNINAFLGQ